MMPSLISGVIRRPTRWMSILACVGTISISGIAALTALTALTAGPSIAQAYPQPSVYPISWELDFKFDMPRRIVVQVPGESAAKAYWYMTYVATNNTDKEQLFLPKFEMVTKEGKVIPSDHGISPVVFEAIQRKERNKPLQPALKLQGQILVGEDQAKYGVAIWQEPQTEMGSFSIFVTGMSGETAALTDSQGKPINNADGSPITLRKTKQIDLTVRGDELYAGDPVVKTGESWVMR